MSSTHRAKVALQITAASMLVLSCSSESGSVLPLSVVDTTELAADAALPVDDSRGEDTMRLRDAGRALRDGGVVPVIPAPGEQSSPSDVVFGGERPATLQVPTSYDPATPIPLLLILHGYSRKPAYVIPVFQMESFHEDLGVLTIAPQGLQNPMGAHYWNGSPACCDSWGSGVDDVAYLSALIESIQSKYNVDSRRIYAIGHSNGAFMAHTLACERPDLLAGIVSVAGAANPSCIPKGPVSVVHAHATGDDIVWYNGGMLNGAVYPGAEATVAYWAEANGCSPESEVVGPLDFNYFAPGAESMISRHLGCPEGGSVELWTEPDGPHTPRLPVDFYFKWWEWMSAHSKPE